MQIGIVNRLNDGGDYFSHVREFGLDVCQLSCWNRELCIPGVAAKVKANAEEAGVRVCAVWAGLPRPAEWNFTGGPTTLGLVPPQYRAERIEVLKRWADFAAWLGAPAIITHCGFIPENLTDPEFEPVVEAIGEVARYCSEKNLGFWFETGQETPIVLLRTIERIGTGNLGINLDPANLIMYGKANPIDALDVFGQYVTNVHVKDGFYPVNGNELGEEVAAGLGKVNFPQFIKRLKEIGFDGELIIERETTGEEQAKDIRDTIVKLKKWWND